MTSPIEQPGLQGRTLRLYGELLCLRESWPGRMALAAFPGAAASGLAAAASLAGAVSLVADADSASVKAHFRDGAFDFVVNTLDEALRAIKNEVRQGRSIAIGLMADPAMVLAEAEERGLEADFILAEKKALAGASLEFNAWLAGRGWYEVEVAREAVEVLLAAVLPADDIIRRKWMRDLAAHQRSVRRVDRWVWLSPEEQRALADATA